MSIEAMKQALEALELLRSGLIQMRRHSEEYGRAWAGAYVEEYQKLLSGSAGEQFRILNALQDRLADVGEAVVDGYQAIASLRQAIAEAEKQEPDELTIAYMSGFFNGKKKREWVGLTEEDLSVCDEDGVILARYWEAKLREKNGC